MRMVDLIAKKKEGYIYNEEEIHYIIDGYIHGKIPDYQMSAWMMAICFQGLNKEETYLLTKEMMNSGEIMDLSTIHQMKVDKHSTGGVGDKTTLVLAPLIASCDLSVAKMSGRGLGHTGGTLDKLEAIPHFQISMSQEKFIKQVNEIGIAIVGQNDHLVLADKKMYALRDVTATVDSIPLIASSIMSKKLAAGSDIISLDVKYGNGAFMKNKEDAYLLAKTMIDIGQSFHKETTAMITNMNQPLGYAIGNHLEVKEAIETLQGRGPKDLTELCIIAASHILIKAKKAKTLQQARKIIEEKIENGDALNKLKEMVEYQGGDIDYIEYPSKYHQVKEIIEINSIKEGYIHDINAFVLGRVAMKLGGGRETKEDNIDYSVGLVLNKKVSNYVHKGETLVFVYTNKGLEKELKEEIIKAYQIKEERKEEPLLIETIIE